MEKMPSARRLRQNKKQTLSDTRRNEAMQAGQILGVRNMYWLHHRDGALHQDPELSARMVETISSRSYDLILSPWEFDGHSDHAYAFAALREALVRTGGNPQLWFYETWTPLLANKVVPVDSVLEDKK